MSCNHGTITGFCFPCFQTEVTRRLRADYYAARGLGETPQSVADAKQAQREQRIMAGVDLDTGRLHRHVCTMDEQLAALPSVTYHKVWG